MALAASGTVTGLVSRPVMSKTIFAPLPNVMCFGAKRPSSAAATGTVSCAPSASTSDSGAKSEPSSQTSEPVPETERRFGVTNVSFESVASAANVTDASTSVSSQDG